MAGGVRALRPLSFTLRRRANMELQSIRCSSLPLLTKCSASLTIEGEHIKPYFDAANLGTCIHAILERALAAGGVDDDAIESLCDEHGLEDETLRTDARVLSYVGWRIWDEHIRPIVDAGNGDYSTELDLQSEFMGVMLTGHADVVCVYERDGRFHALVIDWKTGRVQSDYMPQMHGYAALVARQFPHVETVTAVAVFVRDEEYRKITLKRNDAIQWANRNLNAIVDSSREFAYGAHCQYCPKSHDCPALRKVLATAVGDATGEDVGTDALFTDEGRKYIGEAYDTTRLLKKVVESFDDGLKRFIETNGEIEFGDGRVASMSVSMSDKITNVKAAWPILIESIGGEKLQQCVTIQPGKMKTAIRDATPEGMTKKAREKEILDRLHESDALIQVPSTRLSVRKVK
jgi:hypothetical protein